MYIIVIIIVIVVIITRNAVLSHSSRLSLLPHEEQASNTRQKKLYHAKQHSYIEK